MERQCSWKQHSHTNEKMNIWDHSLIHLLQLRMSKVQVLTWEVYVIIWINHPRHSPKRIMVALGATV